MSILRVIKKFRMILSKHQKVRVLELAVLMLIGGMLETCSVSLMLPFMNTVMDPEDTMKKWYAQWVCKLLHLESPRTFLVAIALLMAVLYVFKNIYLMLEINVQCRFVYHNMFAMQERLLENFLHKPYEYFLNVNSGEVVRIINSDTSNTFSLLSTLLSLFTEIVVSGMLVIAVFVITPMLTFVIAIILLGMLLLINTFLKPILRNAGITQQKASAGMNKWLFQSIQGIKELKVMAREEFFQKNYNIYGRKYVDSMRKSMIFNMVPRFLIEAISMGSMFLVVALLIYHGKSLESIVPIVSAVAMAAMRLLPSVNRVSGALASISYNEPMLDKLIESLKNISGEEDVSLAMDLSYETDDKEKGNVPHLNKTIDFHEITYCYPNAETDVLQAANMVVRRGESIGIVGESGAGKTTAVDIILGLLKPQKGKIFVDGVDICQNMQEWLCQIGYIPQSIFMLDDTIRANVAFGVPEEELSEDEVWRALREAALEKFVRGLPDGLDTQIGERGVRLSGGQRQRIGIARALYQNPEVLIFDEATSALDHETETAIMESIHQLQGQKTMIIIAHRLTTIEACDHVYRVSNGSILMER